MSKINRKMFVVVLKSYSSLGGYRGHNELVEVLRKLPNEISAELQEIDI